MENKIYNKAFVQRAVMIIITTVIAAVLFVFSIKNSEKNKKPAETFEYSERTDFFFDTYISVKIYHGDITDDEKYKIEDALDEMTKMCVMYEELFSKTKETSDVSVLNKEKTAVIHNETYEIITEAIKYSKLTNGAFDITVGTLLQGYSIDDKKIYNTEETEQLLDSVNYNNIMLSVDKNTPSASIADEKTLIDLGGIAKGFIADKIAEYFEKMNIENYLINLGGNILASGAKNKAGEMYTLGIQEPFANMGENIATLKVTDMSVVTSGIYERFFEQNGIMYHHIFSPFTGYPVQNELYSVTIISPSSTACDALSTAVFVMGLDKGMEFINSLDDTYAVFVDNDYKISLSEGLYFEENIIKIK